jgi:signal transduction histidine kinase
VALPIVDPVAESGAFAAMVRQIYQSLEFDQVGAMLARHAADLLGAHGARVDFTDDGARLPATTFGEIPGAGDANRMSAPLTLNGKTIGELTVFAAPQREFTDDDAALLLNLANHGAVAVGNAWRFREASDTARHAHALATAARALAFSTTPESVYAAIALIAQNALGASWFGVLLAARSATRLEMAHTGSRKNDARWTAHECWAAAAANVAATGTPQYVPAIETVVASLPASVARAVRASSVRSMAMLPLPGDSAIHGVFILWFHAAHRFDDGERRLFEDLSAQISAALRNAQLAAAERSGRERERALADAMHQTEKLAALGELVAGVAHELNNPLTGISMFAQLLLDESLDEDQRESVRMIKREADRAVGVIRDLLAFSRKTGPRMVAVDLNALVNQTLRLRAYPLQTAGVQVCPELDAALPAIPGDDRKLQQVLLNLIVNAEYAMHRQETRVLTVRTAWEDAPNGGRVLAEVTDTGTGMAPELVKHIFEPFFTTKPAGVGTGLGLSVSYGIVHAHGGTITVRSTPGAGSTFVVVLPIRAQQLPAPAPTSSGRRRASAPVIQSGPDAAPAAPIAASPSPSAPDSGRATRR